MYRCQPRLRLEGVDAEDLRPGEQILSLDGSSGTVEAVTWTGGPAVMYDLTVGTAHTYHVGDGAWLVHNCDIPLGPNSASISKANEEASGLFPSKARRSEVHHERPIYLGGERSGATSRIPAPYHQLITNAFRQLAPYGTAATKALSDADVTKIMERVYAQFPLR